MVVFGAGGGSDESSGDEEETGSQGSAVDIEDMGRHVHFSLFGAVVLLLRKYLTAIPLFFWVST
jgi:hypothetical protein